MNTEQISNIRFNHAAWAEARPKHLSRRQLARELGTTDSNLIAIEQGKSKPSIMLALRYCYLTRLPLSDLCLTK